MGKNALRILGVVAHPHDFTHFSGTCGVHTSMGDKITIACMTNGTGIHNAQLSEEMAKPPEQRDKSIINQSPEEFAIMKQAELRQAASIFGVSDIRFAEFPDAPFILDQHRESIKFLRDLILEIRPHIMITQSPYAVKQSHGQMSVVHDDHVEVGACSIEAKREAGKPHFGSEDIPHNVALTLFQLGDIQDVDLMIDVGDWYEQRVEAEALYISQGHTLEFARKRMAIGLGSTGWMAGTEYAEQFVREQPERLTHISVSNIEMRQASYTESQGLKHLSGEIEPDP